MLRLHLLGCFSFMVIDIGYDIDVAGLEHHKLMTHDEAILYCSFIGLNGQSNWRLPTITELLKIYSAHNALYTTGTRLMLQVGYNCYWSSTYFEDGFWVGITPHGNKEVLKDSSFCYAMPVRDFT
jgi:hypothetical protein